MRVLTTFISLLFLSLLLIPMLAFAAEQPISLFLNGKQLSANVAPKIVAGNTIVPVRIIAESLGSKVSWEEKSGKVTVDKDEVNIQLFINKQDVIVNKKRYQLETAPSIMDGSTMLPLRFVSEQLGVKVIWDELTHSVFLFDSEQNDEGQVGTGNQTKVPVKPADNSNGKGTDKSTDTDKSTAKVTETVPGKTDSSAQLPTKEGAAKPSEKPITEAQPGKQNPSAADKNLELFTTLSSIAVDGDQFIVKTSGAKATPNMTYTADTNRIIIDFPNSKLDPALKLGTNGEGIIKGNNQSVSQIRYLLFSKDSSIVRIIIDLSKKAAFKPVTTSTSNQFIWALIPAKDRYRVVIDPGHGGKDSGTISAIKRLEKDFVLAMGTKILALLEKEPKIEAFITRKDDTFIELADRAAFANDRDADLFVSVHGNSAGKETVRGVETYYYTEQSLEFANVMHKQMLKSTGFTDRKVKQSGFYVVKNTNMPSLLLEVGFLSNQAEENTMFQDAFQNQVAASIVTAIKQQLNID
ncbi:AMIN domain-containing protein [Paenibacillus sp. LMG 31456]|uniref:AMIN domain-containing protein n=1 Tax=Paenibacillus foliorum TaxID=2654974 RepID=A0A972K5X0_9BACL|nr:N-acetylmuramoyl-L-alanine amidase family protein [Paenibacillus foliorum]NOU97507.1 AMIN domain-containing protein [Paenibacillus foliorum]